jgi:hypothetical protein
MEGDYEATILPRSRYDGVYALESSCLAHGAVVFGKRRITRAHWNNVLAPVLLPLVSAQLGPMTYCMISATKR